jgi:hypothetical protein
VVEVLEKPVVQMVRSMGVMGLLVQFLVHLLLTLEGGQVVAPVVWLALVVVAL